LGEEVLEEGDGGDGGAGAELVELLSQERWRGSHGNKVLTSII
jgi:hypothetical protein